MTMTDIPRLCGGTFFDLLLQAKKQRTSARKKASGDTDGLSDSDALLGLIHIANPEYQNPAKAARDSFRTKTSEYKACRTSSGSYLPFDDPEFAKAFDQRIHTQYTNALSDMISFTEMFINRSRKGAWLVAALLELIESDETIQNEDLFYMGNEEHPLSKLELKTLTEISLHPFLLAIWHYIILNRSDNRIGRNTFNSWHEESVTPGAKRAFISNIGQAPSHVVNVNIGDFSDSSKGNLETSNYSSDIAPELTSVPPLVVLPGELLNPDDEFAEYRENAYNKYSSIKTLLYSDRPRPFYDFYVCNNIYQMIHVSKNTYKRKVISNATADTLSDCSNFIIISGTGGLGKSMMMRHLLLDSIGKYKDNGKLPIFIPLKDYNLSYENLVEYIYEKFESLGGEKDINEFENILSDGACLLLFDGLDEINTSCRKQFERDLDSFADKYAKNMFVISSRPFGSFLSYSRFTVLTLSPFNREQALELIDKLDFRPDEPTIKANFRKELESKLYYTHREFIENPLLLTIMLMTFEQFAEVPSKMHIFYHEAYVALSQKHDASKGAYKRTLSTGLTADRFSDYFAEFCARTYRDEKFELTDIEFEKYYSLLNERRKDDCLADTSDFIYDLTANMCLMYYESQRYHFTHRSFQEYFCALYFSKQKDKNLHAIGNFFENKRGRNYGDITFDMLYNMIPEKVEEYIFTPFLDNLLQQCDVADGYWTFLEIMYPTIFYESGEVGDTNYNEPSSFIYNFIIHQQEITGLIDHKEFPFYHELVTTEYVYLDENWRDSDGEAPDGLINKDEVEPEYIYEYGTPDTVGWNLEFEVADIRSQPDRYETLINFLNDDSFPLKEEYLAIHDFYQQLKVEQDSQGTDLFDLF